MAILDDVVAHLNMVIQQTQQVLRMVEAAKADPQEDRINEAIRLLSGMPKNEVDETEKP